MGAFPQKWTEAYTAWSPEGTILATVHNQGVALWGGANFDRIHRLYHPKVKLIDFSPLENYLVTWSDHPIELSTDPQAPPVFTEDDEGHSIAVWEVMTGKLLRTFPVLNQQPGEDGVRIKFQWPMFKWSGDDRYLARITPGQAISVYETPGMGLLDKKSIKIEGVVDFEWCPLGEKEREAVSESRQLPDEAQKNGAATPNTKKKGAEQPSMLAFWTPEVANQPARVSLMALPSRDTLRSKNLFNVHDVRLHDWVLFLLMLISCTPIRPKSTGNQTATIYVSKLTDTPKQKRLPTATSSFSGSGTNLARLMSSKSKASLAHI